MRLLLILLFVPLSSRAETQFVDEIENRPGDVLVQKDPGFDGYNFYARNVRCDGQTLSFMYRAGGLKLELKFYALCSAKNGMSVADCQQEDTPFIRSCFNRLKESGLEAAAAAKGCESLTGRLTLLENFFHRIHYTYAALPLCQPQSNVNDPCYQQYFEALARQPARDLGFDVRCHLKTMCPDFKFQPHAQECDRYQSLSGRASISAPARVNVDAPEISQ